jgi:serpin B
MVAASGVAAAQGAQDVSALTDAYNASGLALYRDLADAPGNIVLSPYSIGSALSMVRSGARGETEREMAKALRHTLAPAPADAANAAVLAALASYASTSSAKLSVANALVIPKGAAGVGAAYLATVRDKYAGTVLRGADVEAVNAWVSERTAGKIDRFLDGPAPEGPVLLNAVYFKGQWSDAFAKEYTREADFNLTAALRVRVSMMRREGRLALVERTGYRAVRLPYTAETLGMVVLLPNEVDGVDRVANRLDGAELAALLAGLKGAPNRLVALALPRFKASFEANLVPPLKKAGIRLAFSNQADFGGMTAGVGVDRGLKIGAIKHRAVIEVNETGTEAAAATGVIMAPASAQLNPPQPIPFVVDRPFLFLVVDDSTGAILFQGRIADPR